VKIVQIMNEVKVSDLSRDCELLPLNLTVKN